MDALINVRNLVKKFDGGPLVLNQVTFSVAMGDFVAIFGPSGCGKTTLLNIIGGLERPDSGTVEIEGLDIVGMSENELASVRIDKVGFVFQDFNLLNDLTVWENVALPLSFSRKRDGNRVTYLLETFGIGQIANVTANKISGGEAQRVAIARAMMNEPIIILADEPTGNLDEENSDKVVNMFQLARREFGTTIILATHDGKIAQHATRIMDLQDGVIREQERGNQESISSPDMYENRHSNLVK